MRSIFPNANAIEKMLSEEEGQDIRSLVDQSHYVNFPEVDNITYGPELFKKEMLEQPDVLVTPNDPNVPRPNNGYDIKTGLEYSSDTQPYNSNLRDRAGFNGYIDSPIIDNGTQIIDATANSMDALPFVGAEMYSFEDQTNQFSMKKNTQKKPSMHLKGNEALQDGRHMGINYSADFYNHSENGDYVVDTPKLQIEEIGTPIADIDAQGDNTIAQFNRLPIFGGGGFGFMNNRFSQAMNVALASEDRLSQVGTNKKRMLGSLPESVEETGAVEYSFEDQTNQFSRTPKQARPKNTMHSEMDFLRDGREMGVNYSSDFYNHSENGDYVIDNQRAQIEELGTPIADIKADGDSTIEQFNRLPIFGGGGFGFMNNRFSQSMNATLSREDRLSQVGTDRQRMLGGVSNIVNETGAVNYSFEDQTNQFSRVAKPARQQRSMHSEMDYLRDGREMGIDYSSDFYNHSENGDYVIDDRRAQMEELGTPIADIKAEGNNPIQQFDRLPIFGGGGFGFMDNRFSQSMNVALERDHRLSQVGTERERMLGAFPAYNVDYSKTAQITGNLSQAIPSIDADIILTRLTMKRDKLSTILTKIGMTLSSARKNPLPNVENANIGRGASVQAALSAARRQGTAQSQTQTTAESPDVIVVRGLSKSIEIALGMIVKAMQTINSKKAEYAEIKQYLQSKPDDQAALSKIQQIVTAITNIGQQAEKIADSSLTAINEKAKTSPITREILNLVEEDKRKKAKTLNRDQFQIQTTKQPPIAVDRLTPKGEAFDFLRDPSKRPKVIPPSQSKQPPADGIKLMLEQILRLRKESLPSIAAVESRWNLLLSGDYAKIQQKLFVVSSIYTKTLTETLLPKIIEQYASSAKKIITDCKTVKSELDKLEQQLNTIFKEKIAVKQMAFSEMTRKLADLSNMIKYITTSNFDLYTKMNNQVLDSLPTVQIQPAAPPPVASLPPTPPAIQPEQPVQPTQPLEPLPTQPLEPPPSEAMPPKGHGEDIYASEVVAGEIQSTDADGLLQTEQQTDQLQVQDDLQSLPQEDGNLTRTTTTTTTTDLVPSYGSNIVAMEGELPSAQSSSAKAEEKSSNTLWYVLGGVAALGAITYGVMKYRKNK